MQGELEHLARSADCEGNKNLCHHASGRGCLQQDMILSANPRDTRWMPL